MSATSPKPERRNQSGFTLLELLLALTLLVVLCGTLYGSYFALVKGRENAESGMEARRELRNTLDQIRREVCSTLYLYSANDKRFHFVVEDRDSYGKPTSNLSFTAIDPNSDGSGTQSDQIDIRYSIVELKGKMVLARQVKELRVTGEAARYPQMDDVDGFLVECLYGDKWVRTWDTAKNLNMPKAVRVTLTVVEDGKSMPYSVVAVPRMTR